MRSMRPGFQTSQVVLGLCAIPEIVRIAQDDNCMSGAWSLGLRLLQARLGILSQPIPEILQLFFDFPFDSLEIRAFSRVASREQVILYFWFGPGWAYHDSGSTFQPKHQHFRFRNQVAFAISDLVHLKISNAGHF